MSVKTTKDTFYVSGAISPKVAYVVNKHYASTHAFKCNKQEMSNGKARFTPLVDTNGDRILRNPGILVPKIVERNFDEDSSQVFSPSEEKEEIPKYPYNYHFKFPSRVYVDDKDNVYRLAFNKPNMSPHMIEQLNSFLETSFNIYFPEYKQDLTTKSREDVLSFLSGDMLSAYKFKEVLFPKTVERFLMAIPDTIFDFEEAKKRRIEKNLTITENVDFSHTLRIMGNASLRAAHIDNLTSYQVKNLAFVDGDKISVVPISGVSVVDCGDFIITFEYRYEVSVKKFFIATNVILKLAEKEGMTNRMGTYAQLVLSDGTSLSRRKLSVVDLSNLKANEKVSVELSALVDGFPTKFMANIHETVVPVKSMEEFDALPENAVHLLSKEAETEERQFFVSKFVSEVSKRMLTSIDGVPTYKEMYKLGFSDRNLYGFGVSEEMETKLRSLVKGFVSSYVNAIIKHDANASKIKSRYDPEGKNYTCPEGFTVKNAVCF